MVNVYLKGQSGEKKFFIEQEEEIRTVSEILPNCNPKILKKGRILVLYLKRVINERNRTVML